MKQKIVTRIAPGVSGPLHLGSLYNALLNYAYAKRNNGIVFLRLDAPYKTGPAIRFEREIEDALRLFGLVPDFVVKQTDRLSVYREQLEKVLDHPDVYYCQCSNVDITKRFDSGAEGVIIGRGDKYPPPCSIKQVQIFGPDSNTNIAQKSKVSASVTAPGGFEPENVLSNKDIWKPFNPWYYGNEVPSITLSWAKPMLIERIGIQWTRIPPKCVSIFIDGALWAGGKGSKEIVLAEPKRGSKLTIVPSAFAKIIQREYAYDNHCRDRKLKLPLDRPDTFVRRRCDSFVDVLLWNGEERKVDLAFRSAIDDKEFGTTHKIRGVDINVFMELEKCCAELIDHKFENIRHGLILHPNMYKYAKSTAAKDIRHYIEKGLTPNEVLSKLAWKTGLIKKREVFLLKELVEKIEFPKDVKHTIISGEKI